MVQSASRLVSVVEGYSMRDAQQQASNAAGTAATTAGTYGAQAGGIGANLVPFLTRQMTNPQGESQRDIGAQVTQALAGAGGVNAGVTGMAGKEAMTTRNPMGFSAALDAAARSRDKTGAQAGEKVAANNAEVKLNQQSDAAKQLGSLYGTDVKGQLESQSQVAPDVMAQVAANKTGWLQNGEGLVDTGMNVFKTLFPKGLNG